jgi:hypothetical protein
MPAVCKLAGLDHDTCLDCPWPVCVLDLPEIRGCADSPAQVLAGKVATWRRLLSGQPLAIGQHWLRERVTGWMWSRALPMCRDVVREAARYDCEVVEAARAFVETMDRARVPSCIQQADVL